jgi:post-segregation antitoxin (ccd killing protein)
MPKERPLSEEHRRRLLALQESDARSARARASAMENAEAIRVHNERVAERGIFSADARRW